MEILILYRSMMCNAPPIYIYIYIWRRSCIEYILTYTHVCTYYRLIICMPLPGMWKDFGQYVVYGYAITRAKSEYIT